MKLSRVMLVVMALFGTMIAVSLALFGTMVVVNKVRFYYGWKDAFFRTLFAPLEDTVWASDSTVKNFEKIRLSMDEVEVTNFLGEPLRKDCRDREECLWIYSWQATGTDDFDQRWVIFNKAGKVTELKKNFFID